MFRILLRLTTAFAFIAITTQSQAQEYSFDDFVGTWHGTISSTLSDGYNDPITLTIEPDGYYTETSGHLMPSIYPNTQDSEFDAPTNRYHFWYLYLVYSGQSFYQHFYFEIVYFSNDTLEMQYNFWDDPEPWPEAQTIFIVKESTTPPPAGLGLELADSNVLLTWDQPVNYNGGMADPTGYNVYHQLEAGDAELVEFVESTSFTHENVTMAGMHSYYITALYDEEESFPSNQVQVEFLTPSPTYLTGNPYGSDMILSWNEPYIAIGPMAGLLGYNVFHKEENGYYELLGFVESTGYTHTNVSAGIHSYYVTAVYDGGESDPTVEVEVEFVISGLDESNYSSIILYPNPAGQFVTIRTESDIQNVLIYTPAGNGVSSERVHSNNFTLNTSQLESGLYFFILETSDGAAITRKVFIK